MTAGGLGGGGAAGLGGTGFAAGAAGAAGFTGGFAASSFAGGGPSEPSGFCSAGIHYPRGNPTLTICGGGVSNRGKQPGETAISYQLSAISQSPPAPPTWGRAFWPAPRAAGLALRGMLGLNHVPGSRRHQR